MRRDVCLSTSRVPVDGSGGSHRCRCELKRHFPGRRLPGSPAPGLNLYAPWRAYHATVIILYCSIASAKKMSRQGNRRSSRTIKAASKDRPEPSRLDDFFTRILVLGFTGQESATPPDPATSYASWHPLVTPFRDVALDEPSLRHLVRHYASAPVNGLILAATTGEGLTPDQHGADRRSTDICYFQGSIRIFA